jgi:hypothetical protein
MTLQALFTPDEWEQILETPRWVVAAASAAQRDTALRTEEERRQGFIAIAHGRDLGSPLVSEVVEEYLTSRRRVDLDFADRDAGLAATVERVAAVLHVLMTKAAAGDARAYAGWLADITDTVIAAAPSGSIGGPLVTTAEMAFRGRLRDTVKAAIAQHQS